MVDCLKAAGLKEFQVELGQVEFFRGLAEEAGLDEACQERLQELIENKNVFGVEEYLETIPIKPELKEVFLRLPELSGSIRQIRKAKELTCNERALFAIGAWKRCMRSWKTTGCRSTFPLI